MFDRVPIAIRKATCFPIALRPLALGVVHWLAGAIVCCSLEGAGRHVWAVSPDSINLGRQLFEQNWSRRNAALVGNDGLGPLFNGQSCVACHRQGGVGGAGEAEFNAKTISIESMRVSGNQTQRVTLDVVAQLIRGFHPGFVDPRAGIINALPLAHHGGSTGYADSRLALLGQVPALFSENGGSMNAEEVRRSNATPILYSSNDGGYQTTIQAKLFQRNTTALYGAGMIDQVTDKQLRSIEREQKKHPEISGRISTLTNGRLGRFGWRANVASLLDFCDKACAAEVGLETRRIKQPADPTTPSYHNPTFDISDSQIRAMADFIAALPAPVRMLPADSEQRQMAAKGEQVFASIGCAVCHVPDVTPATGIYSDLLLHDMGKESYDLNPADPYIVRATPITKMEFFVTQQSDRSLTMGSASMSDARFYGGHFSMDAGQSVQSSATMLNADTGTASASNLPLLRSVHLTPTEYQFFAQPVPSTRILFIHQNTTAQDFSSTASNDTSEILRRVRSAERMAAVVNSPAVTAPEAATNRPQATQTDYVRVHIEPTFFTQEWRTPPLWGVSDSAPYMHDGRAETLMEAIAMHEGESKGTRDRFLSLPLHDRQSLIEFLNTLVAPPTAPQPQG